MKCTIQTKWDAFVAPTVILQIRKITLLEKEVQGLEKIIRITAKTF